MPGSKPGWTARCLDAGFVFASQRRFIIGVRVLVSWVSSLLCLLLPPAAHAQITDALHVRTLSAEEAKEGRPVRLRATVGFIESPGTVFVQDATAGTFLRTKKLPVEVREGDIVEVKGHTFPGLFIPGVEIDTLEVVGHGEPPAPENASYDDLFAARFHYLRVAVEGIVRSVAAKDENRSVLRLAMGSRVLEVRIDGSTAEGESWVDARVRVTGLAAGTINDRRQMVQPYVRASSWNAVHTLEPARAESSETLPLANLLRFNAMGDTGHRITTSGTVTGVFPEGLVFIRDGDASIAVRLTGSLAPTAVVGDNVTMDGFPVMDRYTPTLADARLLQVAPGPAPGPVTLPLKDLPKKAHDCDLITVAGTVTDVYRGGSGHVVVISSGGSRLQGYLSDSDQMPGIELQSEIEMTGIGRVESVTGKGFNATPEAFSLLLRTGQDLRVVSPPSQWSAERLLTALGILACVVVAGMVWILVLRRQVAAQTLALRAGIQHEAALEERQRIAREFHDTLEQELAGLSLRLDAAATRPLDDKARGLLDTSRNLVSRIQSEARNLVADLRDDPGNQMELAAALQDIQQRQPPNAPEIRVEIDGALPALPPHVVHHLRMMAQEAVTNALKHAHARTITLRLQALADDGVELSIRDNGVGFAPAASTLGTPGHFGCMGVRERCRKIGAEVEWLSKSGEGTTLRITFPAPQAD